MSFDNFKKIVEAGDTVVIYLGKQQLMSFAIDPERTHQTKFGCFPHKNFIGKEFGTKVYGKNNKGWVYLLHPSPELWTVTLPHRTQILYSTDISLITLELDLKPGSVVVESGTGSGSLSHAIIRTIKPNGHLHTFDFHEQRVEKAREEFVSHGVGEFVTCGHADACNEGFQLENIADAVFLDLPAPWDAIPHAKKALKKTGGRVCSFSPCIEQVQRTCDVMRKHRFCEIKTVECLLRPFNIRTLPVPEANLGPNNIEDLTFKPPFDEVRDKPPSDEVKDKPPSQEVKDDIEPINKRIKVESNDEKLSHGEEKLSTEKNENNNLTKINKSGMISKASAKQKHGNINILTSKAGKEMPGHTGYLTFASMYPTWNQDVAK